MNRLDIATLFFVSVLLLCGCTKDVGLIDPETLYPDAITHCAPDPMVPARAAPGVPRTDTQKAQYVESLHAAGQDCRDVVADTATRKSLYIDQFNKQTQDFVTRTWNSVTSGISSLNPF